MASLLSTGDRACAENAVSDLFDTFSRDIVVHKEPIKTINEVADNSGDVLFGYSDAQPNFEYTFTPVSQTFKAKISYRGAMGEDGIIEDVNTRYTEGTCIIKVREDAYNYIKDGKTEKITFDGKNWTILSDDPSVFLDSYYYAFKLREMA